MAVTALKPASKRVAIVCGAPSSEMLAPFNDPSYEVWVLGNRCQKYPRFDRIFEIHDDETEHFDGYHQSIADKGCPVIVGEGFKGKGSNVQTFPFAAANALYGSEYLTSSTAYMVAYAILEGFTRIELYGSDMAVDDHEYFWQRPCLEAWIGFARGRGIEVVIPEVSPLGRSSYVEGRNGSGKPEFKKPPFTQTGFDEMAAMHRQKMSEIDAQMEALKLKRAAFHGALQAYERLSKVARAVESGQAINSLSDTAVLR